MNSINVFENINPFRNEIKCYIISGIIYISRQIDFKKDCLKFYIKWMINMNNFHLSILC